MESPVKRHSYMCACCRPVFGFLAMMSEMRPTLNAGMGITKATRLSLARDRAVCSPSTTTRRRSERDSVGVEESHSLFFGSTSGRWLERSSSSSSWWTQLVSCSFVSTMYPPVCATLAVCECVMLSVRVSEGFVVCAWRRIIE